MADQIPGDYLHKNRDSWNKRTEWHIGSEFYDMEGFLAGASSLQEIELALLGDVRGKSILHLQCHFGQDTISLARMGASVTGVDLSDLAIEKAREIAIQTRVSANASFIRCDLYDLPQHLDETFDLVFASYGTIGWLPDLTRWGKLIARYLKPGGRLVFVEFHPFIWMFDRDLANIEYSYFNVEPIVETLTGTYAAPTAPFTHENVSWNHHFAEVFTALLKNGLTISAFQEYDYSPYNCFANLVEEEPKKYRFAAHGRKLPLVYSLIATR